MPNLRFVLACATGLAPLSCGSRAPDATGPSLALSIAPLQLAGIDYACYDLRIDGPAGPVWSAGDPTRAYVDGDTDTLCSWRYGNGAGGDLAYIAPCDADDGDAEAPATADNTVTLWVDGLYRDPDGDHDPTEDVDIGDWQDPCPDGCTLTATCRENADTLVAFELTLLRQANQGFFDVAVNFADVFCSAKLDCQDTLLHDPATGERGPTAVLAFACTAGAAPDGAPEPTHLYLDDVRVDCAGPPATSYLINPSLGPGNLGGRAPGLFQIATYRGQESLPGYSKCYWNTALGLDVETLADPGVLGPDCTLHARGTASAAPLDGGHTPADAIYPVLTWSVPLTDDTGALVCDSHPLNGTPSGVATTYTDSSGEHFDCALDCVTGSVTCPGRAVCDASPLGLDTPITLSQSEGGAGAPSLVTLAFEGTDYTYTLPPGYAVSTCCADDCCTGGTTR